MTDTTEIGNRGVNADENNSGLRVDTVTSTYIG